VTAETERGTQPVGLGIPGEPDPEWPRAFVDRAVEALAVLTLVVITVLLLVNALGRYLFSLPLLWAEEVATSLVIWLTMLGMFITARRRELIRVRSFIQRLPERTQEAIDVVTDLISVISLSYLTWFAFAYLLTFGGDTTPFLGLSKGVFTAAIPIGSAALALIVVFDLAQRFRGAER
jgi:TRAP-type C4-dicarboxylate transport system permease small subunit